MTGFIVLIALWAWLARNDEAPSRIGGLYD